MTAVGFNAKKEIISLSEFFLEKIASKIKPEEMGDYILYTYPDQVMMPHVVLAFEGNKESLAFFTKWMLFLAEEGWGVSAYHKPGLDTSFRLRNIMVGYIDLCDAGMISVEDQKKIDLWLFEYARIKTDGTIEKMEGFEQWHQKNQHVPTSVVYLIAARLKESPIREQVDIDCLLKWANDRMVGWNITWRCPDDSWLYGYIWILSTYYYASNHAPELLESENAAKSFDWYKKLSNPNGIPIVFGESQPNDFWGPMIAYLICAKVKQDGESLWIAEQMFRNGLKQTADEFAFFRASEVYLYYKFWQYDLEPVKPSATSCYIKSPLPGKGWTFGSTVYNASVKLNDTRFPRFGVDLCDEDDLYLERDPEKYKEEKPDKIVFAQGYEKESLFALVDLRAQGTHDHPDALGIATLINDGVPWLVESVYMPREDNKKRYLHNVPLFQRGFLPPEALLDFRSDTWQEPGSDEVTFEKTDNYAWAVAGIKSDSYDYINFNNNLFDVERFYFFVPDKLFLVADRLISVTDEAKTFGQIWHTTADISCNSDVGAIHESPSTDKILLSRNNKNFNITFAGSNNFEFYQTSHTATEVDPNYYTAPVKDLMWYGYNNKKGKTELLATLLSKEELPLKVEQKGETSLIECGGYRISVGEKVIVDNINE
ncbi:MAG: hypothetical protein ACYTFY_12485 [Planctomycetota bacterium]|jgi:hypothetical protein